MSISNKPTNSYAGLQIPAQFRQFLETIPVPVCIYDLEGRIVSLNAPAIRLWGRPPATGNEWYKYWKFFKTDGSPLAAEDTPLVRTLKEGRAVEGFEVIVERPDGNRLHILPNPQPLHNGEGQLIGALDVLIDLTDRNQFQLLKTHTETLSQTIDALKRSEERYHQMVAEIQDYGIVLLSKDGFVENWNIGAEKAKGYTSEDALGRHLREFFTDEDRERQLPEKLLREASDRGRVYHEGWSLRKDGTKFWNSTSITALHNSDGEIIGFSKISRDQTERLEQEMKIRRFNEDLQQKNELLRQSEERYHRMVTEVEDYVIILLDTDGRIQNWNKGAQKIKGYTADEILGRHFTIFYSAEDRAKGTPEKLLKRAIAQGKAIHEGWRVRKDGSEFWGSVVLTALHDDHGNIVGFTKVTRDLTDKKIAEEKLVATSRELEQKNIELERINEELSSFAYISSHDLQEPLRKIQTFSDRILELEYDHLSEKGKDYFKRMQAGAARMQKLIRDILAYSRATTMEKKLEPCDLNQVIQQAQVELEVPITQKQAVIETDTLPVIEVIPHQMQQLFNNLLSNALKFSKPGVQPIIEVRAEKIKGTELPDITVPPSDWFYHISISDNGIGFKEDYKKKVFEVFQRLHARNEYSGTGIGLAICKKIVENHHGAITAVSEPGEGTIFHIYLPDRRDLKTD